MRMSVRMRDVPVRVTTSRRRLGQASGITDRAEIGRRYRADVIADRLQPLQDRLPLLPVELAQERPQPLNEWIFEQRSAVRFRNEEAVETNIQRFRNLFERAEARRHLSAFNARQIGTRNLRPRLQLTLRRRARLAQLANALADILDRFAIRKLFARRLGAGFLRRSCRRN